MSDDFALSCPLPVPDPARIQLAHGGGGRLMHQLLERTILPLFRNSFLDARHDGAVMPVGGARIAFTTDTYVVRPIVFPGGDIGRLAVNGAVNDLAMCGARPRWLSASLILEEGFPRETLDVVLASMRDAAREAGVEIVTGDTKVVDRGKGDGVYINTAGVGIVEHPLTITPSSVRPGDAILINGDLGRHGIAIMAAREGLEFETTVESDTAPLSGLVLSLLDKGIGIHCMRDLTRGGLASALVEIAEASGLPIEMDETAVETHDNVRGACEILGLDPLYVANEGRCAVFVAEEDAERALALMRAHPNGKGAARIGRVDASGPALVTARTALGTSRIVDMFSGEQLPRIC